MSVYRLRFLYGSAALLLHSNADRHIVLGDLHLGLERRLRDRGIRLYGVAEHMAKQIKKLADDNKADSIILLGDIKESIMYPDSGEKREINEFFALLEGFRIRIAVGNHDGHLSELVTVPVEDEIIIGNVAMLHGHMWPSDAAMAKDYIVVAHNHVAISFKDEKGASYSHKAWLVAKVDHDGAGKRYEKFNMNAKLIVMPAFNDLITGRAVNEFEGTHINPLFRNRIFDYENADIYSMDGSVLGTPSSLAKL